MIALDIEASGLDSGRGGIWQIGALDMKNGKEFFEDARIDDEDEIMEEALEITGKTEKQLRDKKKQSQKQLIANFLDWVSKSDERIMFGHNIGFDIMFIQNKCLRYGLFEKFKEMIGSKSIDLHTIASLKYKERNGKFKLENGKSAMNLKSVLEMVGIKDERKQNINGKISEGKPHNALEDCKLTAECFNKMIGGNSKS